ncbi:MAG: YtxH domain-containing protein [Bacteroidetes bacterium]|nr:YtxH domain-containing protein [Bacteroidota bacterium]
MKKNKKFSTGLFSGIFIGIFGGLLLSPKQREKLKDTLSYRIKKLAGGIYNFLGSFANLKNQPINIAKERSKKVVNTTKTKASKVLDDIKEMTKK